MDPYIGFGNIFICCILTHYSFMFISLLISKKQKEEKQKVSGRLDELREIQYKTKDEQVEFINLKRPPMKKLTFFHFFAGVVTIICYILLFRTYIKILSLTQIKIGAIFGIIIAFVLMQLFEFILRKFNLSTRSTWRLLK